MSDASIKTILARVEALSRKFEKLEGRWAETERVHEDRVGEVLKLAREAIDLFGPVKASVDDLKSRVTKLEGKGATK